MADLSLANKRVLIREDLNVPIAEGKITSDARLRAALPTLKLALEAGAKVMVMSHLGRPTEGQTEDKFSLQPVCDYLSAALNYPVRLVSDYLNGVEVAAGELVIFENIRFNIGEKSNDDALAKQLANLCDIFVMDAFGTAHRAQASTYGVAKFSKTACAGPLLTGELDALAKAIDNPARPLVAIVGGSKVSTK
jgi:phosphoglycerate kinase